MAQPVQELRVDFVSGAVAHRLRFGGGRGQALAKAMGLRAGKTPTVIDATAGLGRDSFLLASLGAQVTMIERSDQMHALLVKGMDEAVQAGGDFANIIGRMQRTCCRPCWLMQF
jgi:16S rRNA (guanine1516-N2)-methyltransferase